MRRGFTENSVLGKCTFCKHTVKEDEKKFASRFARITYGRWICGTCLLGMKEVIEEAEQIYASEAEQRNEMLKKMGYSVNAQTGKIERINNE